jgi:Zn finger protein HypA/HybF involved in hydrogenase expression
MAAIDYFSCNNCNHEFSQQTGSGFYFTIYICENCSNSKRIDHETRAYNVHLKPEQIDKCEKCNGIMKENTETRCPKCESTDLHFDSNESANIS